MRVWIAVLAGLFVAAPAHAIEIVRSSSTSLPFRAELAGEVYLRFRGARIPGGDWARKLSLQRARIELKLELGDHLRAVLEPDFAGQDADLADAYLEVEPIEDLQLVGGQFKSPFGVLETTSRWKLPSLTRGLVSEIMSDRLGFGGRRLGAMIDFQLKDLALKPQLEVGIFGEFSGSSGGDLAARLTLRLIKGGDLQLAYYDRAGAGISGGHGRSGALSFLYSRKGWYAMAEGFIGRARLLRADGLSSDEESTFLSARTLVGLRLPVYEALDLVPFFGAELIDPNLRTRDDRGIDLRGGASLYWLEMFRFGFEIDLQRGESAFVVPDLVAVTVVAAVALE